MEAKLRIVFAGHIQPGLDLAQVKQDAAIRLRASPAQLDQLFSLPRVILKKNVDADYAHAYAETLREIGMLVELEPMPNEGTAGNNAPPAPAPSNPQSSTPAAPSTAQPASTTAAPGIQPPTLETPTKLPAAAAHEAEERIIIPDDSLSPSPLATAHDNPTDDLARSLAPLDAAYGSTAAPSAIHSSYERMQANLAKAEALLNASPKLAPTAVPGTPYTTAEQVQTDEVSVSIAATSAPAGTPELQTVQIAKAPLLFRTTIECTACGTPHIIEGRLMISVVPSGETPTTPI